MEDARENPMIYLIVPFVVVSLVGIAVLAWMAWSFMEQELLKEAQTYDPAMQDKQRQKGKNELDS